MILMMKMSVANNRISGSEMFKNETAKTTYHYGAIQQCYENDSEGMLSIYFLCVLSTLLSVQGSTLLLNTTDNNARKVKLKGLC